MNVHLTFDIEIWCDGWKNLDKVFHKNFDRYIYGRSSHGDYALPKTLEILNKYGLKGVFFVEPLFAARFGIEHLEKIVDLICSAGQEIQLHLHPEWTDEINPPIIPNISKKRQHLSYYTLEEQIELIAFGKSLLESAGGKNINAFRAGSYAANKDTFEALRKNSIACDSSPNRCHPSSFPDIRKDNEFTSAFQINGVSSFPVTVFTDGFGRERPAQIGACSNTEMCDAIQSAFNLGMSDFVIVSHNFEMLKPNTTDPDWIVVRRFNRICEFLARNSNKYNVCGYSEPSMPIASKFSHKRTLPRAKLISTMLRHGEQLVRRFN